MVQSLSRWIVNHPWKSILAGIVLLALLVPGLKKMQADFSHRGFFRSGEPLIAQFDQFERVFGGDDRIALIVYSPSGIFDPESAELIRNLTEEMWNTPDIIRVDSLANYNWTRGEGDQLLTDPFFPEEGAFTQEFLDARKEIALKDEMLPNYLISKDAKTAMLLGRFKPILEGTASYQEGINHLREVAERYRKSDHEIYISGNAMVTQSFKEVSSKDMKIMVPLLLGTIFFLLIFLFRSASGVAIPFLVIIASVLMTFGVAGWVGVKFNSIVSAVPTILISICIADTVHFLATYFQKLGEGLDKKQAAEVSYQKNLAPTFLTSISTGLGFISLSSSYLLPIAGLGILGAAGAIIAWLLTVLWVGPALVLAPSFARTKKGSRKVEIPQEWTKRYVAWLDQHRLKVIGVFTAASLFAAWLGAQNQINSDPMKYLAKDVPFRVATDFMDEHIGGASGPEIVVDSGEPDGVKNPIFAKKVAALETWMESRQIYSKTVSYTDIIKQVNRALNGNKQEYYRIPDSRDLIAQELFLYSLNMPPGMELNDRISLDNRSVRISGLWIIHDSNRVLSEIAAIEAKAKELGLNAHVTGKMPIYQKMNGYVVQTFFTSILAALLLIAVLMSIVFKSIKLGFLSMIPNILPLCFGAAMMTLLKRPLDIGTTIVSAICLGVVVDDTIHMLSCYHRERKSGQSPRSALQEVIRTTGAALSGTTFVLVCGFGTFLLASFVPNQNLGIATMLIMTVALAMDLIFLPAILLWMDPAPATATVTVGAGKTTTPGLTTRPAQESGTRQLKT